MSKPDALSMNLYDRKGLETLKITLPHWSNAWRNLPMIIFVHVDDSMLMSDLTSYLRNQNVKNFVLVTHEELLTAYHNVDDCEGNIYLYKGRGLLLMDWYLYKFTEFKTIFIVEEDIVLQGELFDCKTNCLTRLAPGRSKASYTLCESNPVQMADFKVLFDVAGLELTEYTYQRHYYIPHCVGAPRVISRQDFDIALYEDCLMRFNRNDGIKLRINKSNTWHAKSLDEDFHVVTYSQMPLNNLQSFVHTLMVRPDKLTPDKTRTRKQIIHFAIDDKRTLYDAYTSIMPLRRYDHADT